MAGCATSKQATAKDVRSSRTNRPFIWTSRSFLPFSPIFSAANIVPASHVSLGEAAKRHSCRQLHTTPGMALSVLAGDAPARPEFLTKICSGRGCPAGPPLGKSEFSNSRATNSRIRIERSVEVCAVTACGHTNHVIHQTNDLRLAAGCSLEDHPLLVLLANLTGPVALAV